MYVVKNKSYNKSIKTGAEIIDINGKKPSELFADYKHWFASDGYNKTFITNRLARSFGMFYGFHNTPKDSLNFNFKYNDSLKKVTILRKVVDTAEANKLKKLVGKKLSDFEKAKNKADKIHKDVFGYDVDKKIYNRNLKFMEKDSSIAVLKINSFTKGDDFKTFYDEAFSKIEYRNTKTLIIDIRNNTGGRLSEIAYLYSFLSDSTFVFMDKAQVTKKSSLLHAEYFKGGSIATKAFKAVLSPFYYSFMYLRVHKNDDGNYYYSSESSPKTIKKDAFKGKIYVLINGGCFSASSILSSNLKGSKRAFFVGEETGGAQNGTVAGQMPIIKIPNSNLNLKLGLSTCLPHYKTEKEGRGIFPDKEIIPTLQDRINDVDPEMNWVLDNIKK
jgi:Peptidase family S41